MWSVLSRTASWRKTCRCKPRARQLLQSWGCHGTQPVNGLKQARRAGNIPEPVPEDLAAENARLRRENQELRDTNELLKAASAFFASELDPKRRK